MPGKFTVTRFSHLSAIWLGVLLIALLFVNSRQKSDNNDGTNLNFPAAFSFSERVIDQVNYYVLTSNGYEEIPVSGSFNQFLPALTAILPELDTLLSEIQLLNTSQARLIVYEPGFDTTYLDVLYTRSGDNLFIELEPAEPPVEFQLTSNGQILRLPLVFSYYSFEGFGGETDYGSLEIDYNSEATPTQIISNLRISNDLVEGDTIALGFGWEIYN